MVGVGLVLVTLHGRFTTSIKKDKYSMNNYNIYLLRIVTRTNWHNRCGK